MFLNLADKITKVKKVEVILLYNQVVNTFLYYDLI